MPLRLIIVVVVRMQCLLLPLYGLHLFVQSLVPDDAYSGARSSPSVAIPFFACLLALAFWQMAPWLARLILGERDASVTLAGLR